MSNLVNIVDNSFYYLCRLCALKLDTPGLGIFSDEGLWREIPKKIQECLHFTIEQGDRCPKTICANCVFKLDLSHEFLIKCLESQQFLSELFKHEMFESVYIVKDSMQRRDFEILELSELQDQPSMQELEHLVDEAHMHADSNDITQIIQYHDGELNEEQITEINQIDNITPLPKDTYSLPDIALYSFDDISEAGDNYLDDTSFHNSSNSKLEAIIKETESKIITEEKPMPKKNNSTPKVCQVCQKTFRTNYKLNEHMRRHSNIASFKCPHNGCNKAFRSKIGLIEHEANHTGIFKYMCEQCGKGFQIQSYYKIHLKTHSEEKPYKCSTCGLMLKAKQALVNHENRHLGLKPFKCDRCDQKFLTAALLRHHEKTHLNTEPARKFPCQVCNKLFVRRAYLKVHMATHTGDKPFVCDICGNKFLTGLDLRQHTKTHTGEKGHVCEICGKAFTRADTLKVHMRSHTGERPYKCVYCNQQFVQISSMKIHIRLHTGEKPYACHLCTRRFVSKTYLQSHLKKHDDGKHSDEQDLNNELNDLLSG